MQLADTFTHFYSRASFHENNLGLNALFKGTTVAFKIQTHCFQAISMLATFLNHYASAAFLKHYATTLHSRHLSILIFQNSI